jgi:cyanophycinase-like exopeptidase
MAKGFIALMGSGETAPGMTKVHRELLSRYSDVKAVNLDTTYGFQENIPEMNAKLEGYFEVSLNTPVTSLHFGKFDEATELDRETFRLKVREANYVFSGPGSPSFAVKQWEPLGLRDDLLTVLANGGTLCFASAAALTLGSKTAPIYEIYKAGSDLYWLDGLDVMSAIGLNCVVIPHFDNNEGANYDTSCCYLGLRRLSLMEKDLPGVATLGIDEHTALIIDLEADTVQVVGKGAGHWRLNGVDKVLANASVTPLSELRNYDAPQHTAPIAEAVSSTSTAKELAEVVAKRGDSSLSALASLVTMAEQGGTGFIDPTALINGILEARQSARESKQYALSDQLRDILINAKVEINDTPDGTTWELGR